LSVRRAVIAQNTWILFKASSSTTNSPNTVLAAATRYSSTARASSYHRAIVNSSPITTTTTSPVATIELEEDDEPEVAPPLIFNQGVVVETLDLTHAMEQAPNQSLIQLSISLQPLWLFARTGFQASAALQPVFDEWFT